MNGYLVALLLCAVGPVVGCSTKIAEILTPPPPPTASIITITISPTLNDGRLKVGASVQMSLTTNIPPTYTVAWVAADTAVFSASSTGLVEGRKVGSSSLTTEVVYDSGRRTSRTVTEVVVFP